MSAPGLPLIAMSGYAFTNPGSPTPDVLEMALDLGASGLSAKARSRQRHCWLRSKRVLKIGNDESSFG